MRLIWIGGLKMKHHVSTLLVNNSEISSKIRQFCLSFPEFQQAERTARLALQRLEDVLGKEEFYKLEDAITAYYAMEAQAHYLFGLNLRQELRAELFT